MQTMTLWILLVGGLLFSAPAFGDPGVGTWTGTGGCSRKAMASGDTCAYSFADSDVHSVSIRLGDGPWTILFDPGDDSDGADTAQVQIRCVVDPAGTQDDNNSYILNGLTLTGAAGADAIYEVPAGICWVDVTTVSGGETAVVTIRHG